MRCFACLLVCGLIVSGCASKPDPAEKQSAVHKAIITPDNSRNGKVVRVNDAARFAVLNFPIGLVPPIGQSLSAYHRGLKVGELKVTGPQGDENTVADITNGQVGVGDEVRTP